MTASEVVHAIEKDRARLYAAVDALGPAAETLPITDEGFTARDVVAFLIHWAGQIAFGVGARLVPPRYVIEATDRPHPDEWNARAVRFHADRSLDALKAELDRNVEALIQQIRTRSDPELLARDALPWAGDRPLWKQIGIETFENWRYYAERIERAREGG